MPRLFRIACLIAVFVFVDLNAASAKHNTLTHQELADGWILLFDGETDFLVVSLGTGELTRPIPYNDAKDWGLLEWALPILSVVFDGVSDAVDYQLRQILGDNFFRFQIRLEHANDDMDDASRRNLEALQREAERLIEVQRADLQRVCELIS